VTLRGRMITLEGVDGAGKSTHLAWLADTIKALGHEVVVTREPGGTVLGEALRLLLLNQPMHPETEALLMFGARREHVAEIIEPALARGEWVLCDRFSDASFAYQGAARGVSLPKLEILEHWVHEQIRPDLTLLFDLSGDTAKTRLSGVRDPDKFEREDAAFFEKVREGYRARMQADPKRFVLIDGRHSIAQIREELTGIIQSFSSKK
jgi:dTMP kinase